MTRCMTVVYMGVVTVRVPEDVRKKLRRYNVNVSEVVRSLLDKHILELEQKELADRLESLQERLAGRLDPALVAKMVREDREAH